jgi:ATP-dependent Clp protease ATP-binding subunit ClpC
MFERFTDRARRSVELAQGVAADLGHDSVGTDHLLLGLIGEGGGVAFRALDALGVTTEAASEAVCRRHKAGTRRTEGHLPWTPGFRKVAELALRESLELGNNFIGTEHLLLGLIRDADNCEGAQALADCGTARVDRDWRGDRDLLADVRAKVTELLRGYAETEKRAAAPPAETRAPRLAEQQAFAWKLVARMRKFLGHIEDMGDDERLFMLGAMAGALEGMLRDAGVPEPQQG